MCDKLRPPPAGTLVDILQSRAAETPDRPAYIFLSDGESREEIWTYGELDQAARAVAARLLELAEPGARALLAFPPGLEFLGGFFGCLYAGMVAVPVCPPARRRAASSVECIAADAAAAVGLTTARLLASGRLGGAGQHGCGPRWFNVDTLVGGDSPALAQTRRLPVSTEKSLALLQYTSGSTSRPRGVMLDHANLLCAEEVIRKAFRHTGETVVAGWLPAYHDMGLIGTMLQPLYLGVPYVFISPLHFIQQPRRWLELISRYRATTSGGPNFAYDLCVRRIPPEQRHGLDLSSWAVAFNGSEPIRAETLDLFTRAFAPHGFREEAFVPCYGLAEASLLVSGSAGHGPPRARSWPRAALGLSRRAPGLPEEKANAELRLVGCGRVGDGLHVAVVDPETGVECSPATAGEIWVQGPTVGRGYWNRREESCATFAARTHPDSPGEYLRTGDLGLLCDGELFVIGRLKDVIIIRGRNLYPQDIEQVSRYCHPCLRPAVAAFTVEADGEESLVVVQEAERTARATDLAAAAGLIRQSLAEEFQIQPQAIVLVPPGELPRTTSGKIQIHLCRAKYLQGSLSTLAVSRAGTTCGGQQGQEISETHDDEYGGHRYVRAHLTRWVAAILGVDERGVDPGLSLTGLGLDSLGCATLGGLIAKTFGVSLPLSLLLDGSTINRLAERALIAGPNVGVPETAVDARGGAAVSVPAGNAGATQLSEGQRSLWLLQEVDTARTDFVIARGVRVRGEFDSSAFRVALEVLVARHAALRTRIIQEPTGLGPRAQVMPTPSFDFGEVNATGWGEARLGRVMADDAYGPFDLQRGPLFRVRVYLGSPPGPVLLFSAHHLITDLLSFAVLLHELDALLGGRSLPSPAPPYADFVSWQRRRLDGAEGERDRNFWRTVLARPAQTPWPGDRHAHAPATGVFRLALPKDLSRRLAALAARERVTLNTVLLSAFQILLHACTEQEQVLVGTPAAARPQGFERTVGLFANILLLSSDMRQSQPYRSFLKQVQGVVSRALDHQHYPFERVVEMLRPIRGARPTEILHTMFVFQSTPSWAPTGLGLLAIGQPGAYAEVGGSVWELLELEPPPTPYDLSLSLTDGEGGVTCVFQFKVNLLSRELIAHMSERYLTILAQVVTDPGQPLSHLAAEPGAKERDVRRAGPTAVSDAPPDAGALHACFERYARETPLAVALTDGSRSFTYQEVNEHADAVARHLLRRGVTPGEFIAVAAEPSSELVFAILGVLKAGAAYVPLDPSHPPGRLAYIADDSGVSLILTLRHLRTQLGGTGREVVCVEDVVGAGQDSTGAGRQHAAPGSDPGGRLPPNAPAYVIYTSGTTGRPKGVVISHADVLGLFRATEHEFGFCPDDTWTLFHSCGFDFSVWEMWGAWLYGGRVVIVPHEAVRSPEILYDLLARERVTVLNQTPSAFRQLISICAGEGFVSGTQARPALRLIVLGGEAIHPTELAPWFERFGEERPLVVNMYGLTEGTIHVTLRRLMAEDAARGEGSVIGHPLRGKTLHLLDERGNPASEGVVGEIYVGGAGLAWGYLGRPALTAERFVPDPFAAAVGARMYRTGDLARRLTDGGYEYVGRADRQVKIRGHRIEPEEIENILLRHPHVRAAAVDARDERLMTGDGAGDLTPEEEAAGGVEWPGEFRRFLKPVPSRREAAGGGKVLVAYVACDRSAASARVLRDYLRESLPAFMIPAAFVLVEKLPLTPNGKPDLPALAGYVNQGQVPDSTYEAPTTWVERALADLWSEVLDVAPVGVRDNFFDLGGDSIRGLQLVMRARDAGFAISVADIFRHPILCELATNIRPWGGDFTPSPPFGLLREGERVFVHDSAEDAYPLGRTQAGIVFHCRLYPDPRLYHDLFFYRLRAPFDAERLCGALENICARHPALRTAFLLDAPTEPLQVVHTSVQTPFTVVDLRGLSGEAQRAAQLEWAEQQKQHPFELEQPPLIRFAAHRLADDLFDLVLDFHDSILDGWSVALLLTEVLGVYSAALVGDTYPLHGGGLRLADFVMAEREALASEESRRFWTELMRDCPPEPLRELIPARAGEGKAEIVVLSIPVSVEMSDGLKSAARRSQVSLKQLLLAAHMKVLGLVAGESDVVTGLELNGRVEAAGGDRSVGMHLNTVPFRLRLRRGSWIELARDIAAAEAVLFPHRRFPLAEIQQCVKRRPLFNSVFNYTHFHVLKSLGRRHNMRVLGAWGFEQTHFPLRAEFNRHPFTDDVQLDLVADAKVLARDRLGRIGEYYLETLRAISTSPSACHADVVLLPDAELQQLESWGSAPPLGDTGPPVHVLIERHAASAPGRTAVVSGDKRLSYGELNERAEALARRLKVAGVGAETPVILALERSVEFVVALLAVLKAGGAYVPLDPLHPDARLKATIRDSGARVLVTTSALRGRFAGAAPVVIEADGEAAPVALDGLFKDAPEPDALAYVIYTSGSTGEPKGVEVTHGALANLLASMRRLLDLRREDALLAVTTFSFDIATMELLLPLSVGARVVVASRAEVTDGLALAKAVTRHEPTFMQATPATWRMLLSAGWAGSRRLTILCGGEALPPQLAAELVGRAQAVWNLYGPTETTIWSAARRVDAPLGAGRIGGPLGGTRLHVLDAHLAPAPVGTPGELYIGGPGLARGYHNAPSPTAEKFIPDPFSHARGARLYRTGDRARFRPDGTIEILSRVDNQLKVRGFRIEPGEVEHALCLHPGVSAAVVHAREDSTGEKYLVANFEAALTPAPAPSELTLFLRERLPPHMVPSFVFQVPEFPRLPNGKIARRLVADQVPLPTTRERAARPPRNGIERRIASVWAELLGLQEVGVDENFFELGGHSLLAMRAVNRLGKFFSYDIPVGVLFESPTVAALAERVEAGLPSGAEVRATSTFTKASPGLPEDELEQLLREVTELPDEEVRRRLADLEARAVATSDHDS